MTVSLDEALAFLETVSLPAPFFSGALDSEYGPGLPRPDYALSGEMSVAIGSQIASFAGALSPAIRKRIADTFLLAQLAADKRLETGGGSGETWYDTYVATLSKVGWTTEDEDRTLRRISGTSASVHREIISVVTLLLGPAVDHRDRGHGGPERP